ncbi:MAG: hypothetical protein IKJ73_01625 [Lachnospiraceae bacterium]|nr:hypothetical protein [Lachnospiraceae bacterium]
MEISIRCYYHLEADTPYTYGVTTTDYVGTLTMNISVYDSDDEESLMQRIKTALNDNTVLDIDNSNIYGPSISRTTSGYYGSVNNHQIDVPIYKVWRDLGIQTGAQKDECFHIKYDVFRLKELGLENTNVLTRKDSEKAMNSIRDAVKFVSDQRSLFGAYTNRMEFTLNSNENYAENLQAAESQIRDTDMAYEIMEHSKISILQQAAQAMLTNANSQPENVLQLLP